VTVGQFAGRRLLEGGAGQKDLQGLKPNVYLMSLIGTTEVMPCYKAFEIGA